MAQSNVEDFKRALLDGPSGLKEVHHKLATQLENLRKFKGKQTELNEALEDRKKKILEARKRILSLKFSIQSVKAENEARVKHIEGFRKFTKEREDSIRNIENIDRTISENATKKISLVERK